MAKQHPLRADILADLARSGLDEADAKRMRILHLNDAKVLVPSEDAHKYEKVNGYVIPYFSATGQPLSFFRIRMLGELPLNRKGKTMRYIQAPLTPPHLYLAPNIDWTRVINTADIPVIITEGEKKAYAACKQLKGYPTIGLGGIYSYGSKSLNEAVLPEFEQFFKGRRVIVCYDREAVPNKDVTMAYNRLARRAKVGGAEVYRLELPAGETADKVGLDDALVQLGADGVLELLESKLEPYEDLKLLQELNTKLAFIEEGDSIYHLPNKALYALPTQLINVVYAGWRITKFNNDGELVEKNAVSEWLKWSGRRVHRRLAYEPGQPTVLKDHSLNTWPGLAVAPKRGNVQPFIKLLDQVFADDPDGAARRWCLQWLAYPLQHPGTKLYAAVLMYSEGTGMGKSLIGETMGRIYGENFSAIDAEELHSNYNYWAHRKQFILGDEVTGRDRKEDENRLKNIVTRERVTITAKYQASYQVPDRANYWLTTNHVNALLLMRQDRRWFVWEILRQTLSVGWYTEVYDAWYRKNEHISAILHYLLHDVKLTGFNPHAPAPVTAGKLDMQQVSGSGVDFRIRELLAAPAGALLDPLRDLYTAGEIAYALEPGGRLDPAQTAVALKRAGAIRLPGTAVSRGTIYLYAIRNYEKWTGATHADRVAHYDRDLTQLAKSVEVNTNKKKTARVKK